MSRIYVIILLAPALLACPASYHDVQFLDAQYRGVIGDGHGRVWDTTDPAGRDYRKDDRQLWLYGDMTGLTGCHTVTPDKRVTLTPSSGPWGVNHFSPDANYGHTDCPNMYVVEYDVSAVRQPIPNGGYYAGPDLWLASNSPVLGQATTRERCELISVQVAFYSRESGRWYKHREEAFNAHWDGRMCMWYWPEHSAVYEGANMFWIYGKDRIRIATSFWDGDNKAIGGSYLAR